MVSLEWRYVRAAAAIGVIAVVAFFRPSGETEDNGPRSASFDCQSADLAALCRDGNTMIGAMANICGSENVKTITEINAKQGTVRGSYQMTISCRSLTARWSSATGKAPRSLDELISMEMNEDAERVTSVLVQLGSGQITLDAARLLLFEGTQEPRSP